MTPRARGRVCERIFVVIRGCVSDVRNPCGSFLVAALIGEHVQFVLLKLRKYFTRACKNRGRQTGEARDFDTVRLRRATTLDAVEKDDFVLALGDANTVVLRSGQTLGKLGQFVIVRCEKCLCRMAGRVV